MLFYIYKPKTNTSRTNITNDDEQAYNVFPLYGGESTDFHCHMIPVVVFNYSETLESILVDYAAVMIIRMLLHKAKVWGEMVLLHLFSTFPNV